jgi:hypothetical protein
MKYVTHFWKTAHYKHETMYVNYDISNSQGSESEDYGLL